MKTSSTLIRSLLRIRLFFVSFSAVMFFTKRDTFMVYFFILYFDKEHEYEEIQCF